MQVSAFLIQAIPGHLTKRGGKGEAYRESSLYSYRFRVISVVLPKTPSSSVSVAVGALLFRRILKRASRMILFTVGLAFP